MTEQSVSKYGSALTGSDWAGLPLRIGEIPAVGEVHDLLGEVDAVLVWSGGPSKVTIEYEVPGSLQMSQYAFERVSGMIDLLPSGTKMQRIVWHGEESTCVSVNLPRASLSALGGETILGLDCSRGPRFGLIDAHVVDLVHRLKQQAEARDYLGAVYVQSLSLALASYLSARYGAGASSRSLASGAELSAVQRAEIERFVDAELENNFGLIDLAHLVGYCPDHFSRLFKISFDQSPYQYVLTRRIEKAKAMLRDEAFSIAEIALACGFSSQAHLSSVFKQRVGMTPGVYRRG